MKKKNLLIGVLIAAVIVLAASIFLRVILTKERLAAMIVPRLEKAVDASIEIGDIGIRFPFGFGVDIGKMTFVKELPGTGTIRFDSEKITVDASLISLIRRNPEIKRVSVKNGSLLSSLSEKEIDLALIGFEAGLSVLPDGNSYNIDADISISGIEAEKKNEEGKFRVENVSISCKAVSNRSFDSIKIDDAAVDINGLIKAVVSGQVNSLNGKRELSLRIDSDPIEAVPLMGWVLGLDLRPFVPSMKEGVIAADLPADLAGGRVSFSADLAGDPAVPGELAVNGAVMAEGLILEPRDIALPVVIDGTIKISDKVISSEKITASAGKSSATAGFSLKPSGDGPEKRADFSCIIDLDGGDLSKGLPDGASPVAGKIMADIRGGGTPAVFSSLFPGGDGGIPREAIESAWKDIELKGTLKIENAGMKSPDGLVVISGFKGSANIMKGSIDQVKAEFLLNGSRYSAKASLNGIMPAIAELKVIEEKKEVTGFAEILDSVKNIPKISLEVSGRALDLRPFSREAEKRKKISKSAAVKKENETAEKNLFGGALLFLFDCSAGMKVDTLYTEKALLSAVSGAGRIRRGKILIDPLSFDYAGGKGNGTASIDLRDPESVKSKFNLAFSGVEAGRALSPLHNMGNLVSGKFSFSTKGELSSGPDIDLLKTISVLGNASSEGGKIDLSKFISPVSNIAGFDLSAIEKVDFHKWAGNFFIEKGRLGTDDWKIDSSSGNWDVNGSFGFDGTLDYKARLFMTPQMQKKIKDLNKYRDLIDLFRDEKGNLILDLDVSGNSKTPKVGIDQSRAQKKAGEKLLEGIKKGIGDLFKKE
ncbi:MAG: hypothetical protein JW746_05360 [Candidatus Krumholzibacteriota bacterium]|nr:hypothetical protein [Candidatus Krumholzibacteriota bacterium]